MRKEWGWRTGILKCAHCHGKFVAVLPAEWVCVQCPHCEKETRLRFVDEKKNRMAVQHTPIYVFEEATNCASRAERQYDLF